MEQAQRYEVLGSLFGSYEEAFRALVEAYFLGGVPEEKTAQEWAVEIEESGWLSGFAERYGAYRSDALEEVVQDLLGKG